MRILQLNTSDVGGGAEAVAGQLLRRYRQRGHWSRLVVGVKHSDDPDVVSLSPHARDSRLYDVIDGIAGPRPGLALRNPRTALARLRGSEDVFSPESWRLLDRLDTPRPDVLHMHNLHGASYFDLRALPQLSQRVPTVVTLHDMWLMTGHCAHSLDCRRWAIGCGSCPDLTLYPAIRRDNTAQNHARKAHILARSHLYLSAPCEWLLGLARQSALGQTAVEARVVHNGVDTTVFAPGDRSTARLRLGLPLDAQVILYAAARGSNNLWRDFSTLRLALQQLSGSAPSRRILCVVLGSAAPAEHIGQIKVHFVERQADPRQVALFYQSADVYVHPTRADTFPLAILEALACGTPVVASAVGGIPEQIRHMPVPGLATPADVQSADVADATGVLVPLADAGALAASLGFILDDEPRRRRLAANARRDVLLRFSLDDTVENWLAWYAEMMARPAAAEQN